LLENCNEIRIIDINITLIYIGDDDDDYLTLRKAIYTEKVGQVTALNGRSSSGGPEGTHNTVTKILN